VSGLNTKPKRRSPISRRHRKLYTSIQFSMLQESDCGWNKGMAIAPLIV